MGAMNVLEVTWWWGRTLLAVRHVDGVRAVDWMEGDGRTAWLAVRAGHVRVAVPAGARVARSDDADPATALRPGDAALASWHGQRVMVRWVAREPAAGAAPLRADLPFAASCAAVLGVSSLLALVASEAPAEEPPPPLARLAAVISRVGPTVRPPTKPPRPPRVASTVTAPRVHRPSGTRVRRPVDPARRERDRAAAMGAGVLGMLRGRGGALGAVLGGALGGDVNQALQGLGPGAVVAGDGSGFSSRGGGPGGGGTGVVGIGGLGDGTGRGPGGTGWPDGGGPHRAKVVGGCRDCAPQDGLGRDEVARVVRRHHARISYCYERELNGHPDLGGRVEARFSIGADGRVAHAEVGSTTLNHPPTEDCVLGVLRSMIFPRPRSGGEVAVNYPFLFQSAGR
ncbi:MAG: AgmX/PglI C-terminal domain-containing protein [Deltaproteobacteria bacterium]|nr:AgmX/PglI C-terminal domain-containing protein [Deltaproteobacteria bacterium]